MTDTEAARLHRLLRGVADHPETLKMRRYTQHGRISTYAHCLRVARASFWLNRRLHLCADERRLVRGAFLHDFYLYDWHDCDNVTRLHGFTHPQRALANARRCFALDAVEQDIIITHMWPLTLRHMPACRESVIVCLADKWCSLQETLFCRKTKNIY